jgi:hypothetical protein
VRPVEGLPCWEAFFEDFVDAGFTAVGEVSALGLEETGINASFPGERADFAEETLREVAFFLSEKDKIFFKGEQGFATTGTPRDAASIADLNFAESVLLSCNENCSASNGESGHEPRT